LHRGERGVPPIRALTAAPGYSLSMESTFVRLAQRLHRISVAMGSLLVVVAVLAIATGGIGAWRQALLLAVVALLAYGIGRLTHHRLASRLDRPGASGELRD
jgi:uncharacterized membrane protein YozB (DUF420 family)